MRLSTRVWTSVNTKSLVMGVLIAAGVIAFAVTGVGFNMGGGVADSNVAAKVGSQTVPMRALVNVAQDLDRQTGAADEARRQANIQNALNQLINEKIFVEEANRLGWGATDLEVADWIKKVPAFQNKDTKQFDPAMYKKFIKNGQFSELELFRDGRDNISTRKYYGLLGLPDAMPKQLVSDLSARDSTEFMFEYAEVKPSELAISKATADESKKFAEDKANEARLKAAYDSAKTEFNRPAQTKIKSILIGYKGVQRAQGDAEKRTEQDAQKLADTLHARLKGGEDFAKLAKETNDDPTAKSAAGDLGWIDESNIDPDTAKVAATLTDKASLSGVIKTPYGFRIIKRMENRPAVTKSFEDAKLELAQRIVGAETRTKLTDELKKELNTALAAKDTKKVADLMAANGMSWKKIAKPVTASNRFIEELGLSEPLLKKAFALKAPGEFVPEVIDLSGKQAVFKLVERKAPATPDDKKLETVERSENGRFAQTFVSQTQRKLFDVYTRDKQIQRNKALLQ